MSRGPIQNSRLEPQYIKGGIPTTAPAQLTPCLLCLPPILYMTYRDPISGYSKAPRGLPVPPRVTGVFTGTTISPSPPPRQRPDRYTIRAGQNLPDKEFRYLRTVIVTAAVYWGFGSKLLRHSANAVKSFFHATGYPLPKPSPGKVLRITRVRASPFVLKYIHIIHGFNS